MATKYFKYTIETDNVHKAVNDVHGHGIVVRTHTEGGKTHVYVAAEKAAEGAKASEVSESDVHKIG
jgi:hypothetical protein